jgi:delta-aminolevulinic acid dehydratase/porphobilinogen synthase
MKLDEMMKTLILNQRAYLSHKFYYPFHDETDLENFFKSRLQFHFPNTNIDEIFDEIEAEFYERFDELMEATNKDYSNEEMTESEKEDYERFGLHLTP